SLRLPRSPALRAPVPAPLFLLLRLQNLPPSAPPPTQWPPPWSYQSGPVGQLSTSGDVAVPVRAEPSLYTKHCRQTRVGALLIRPCSCSNQNHPSCNFQGSLLVSKSRFISIHQAQISRSQQF